MQNLLTQPQGGTKPADTMAYDVRDVSGHKIFSQGQSGYAHALAHRLTDTARWHLGHRLLGEWLDTHRGQGSDWVHLQFHMAIFELALGEWHAAHRRFLSEVLPAASGTADALTDAPALLWRLALATPEPVTLPWEAIRRTALAHLYDTPDPFVQLHHLMALAGAKDAVSITRWIKATSKYAKTKDQRIVQRFALAMLALGAGEFPPAADLLHAVLPDLPALGGSQAQNQLFGLLADWAVQQAATGASASVHRQAA